MTNWLVQEGYPVVNVTLNSINSTAIVYDLKQTYFLLSSDLVQKKEYFNLHFYLFLLFK